MRFKFKYAEPLGTMAAVVIGILGGLLGWPFLLVLVGIVVASTVATFCDSDRP